MAGHRNTSVQLWLPLLPAAVALLLLALVLLLVEQIVVKELERRAEQRVGQAADLYADQLSRSLARRAAELEMLADLPAKGIAPAVWRQQIDRLRKSSRAYVWIGATDDQGQVIAGSDGLLEGANIAQRPVFQEGSRGLWFGSLHPPVALTQPLRERQLPVPDDMADIAQPYLDGQGRRGVLAAHLNVEFFELQRQRALGPAEMQRGLQIEVIDGRGRPQFGVAPPIGPTGQAALLMAPPGAPQLLAGADGERLLLVRLPVHPTDSNLRTDWQVLAWQPLGLVLAPVRELQRTLLWAGGASALLLGALGFWLSRRIARPYSELLDAVADQLHPKLDAAPGAVLRVINEQMRRLPPRGGASRGELALVQVLHDASRLQALLDHLPAPLYLVDMQFKVLYWNRAAERMFGWSAEEARGRHISELLRGDSLGEERAATRREIAHQPGPWLFDASMQHRDGHAVTGEWRLTKMFNPDGEAVGVLAQVRDLTAQREVERALREQAEVLGAVINSASDAVISVDQQGRITLFNPAAERIFGRTASDMLGQPLDPLLPAAHRGSHLQQMARFAESRATTRPMGFGRVKGQHADGSAIELEASISQVTVRGQKLLTAILRDVTDRVRAEHALARYQTELSELTQRLLQQEQTTTRELAQTLHDQLGQTLGAIRLSYDALAGMTRGRIEEPRALERARLVSQQIDQAILEVRQALVKLRPPLLESSGLVAALDNEIRQRAPEAAPVALGLVHEVPVAELRWPEEVEYAAFMVAREAVANALQHARASQVRVRVAGDAEHLRLDIGDDGIGLPDDVIQGRPGHLGIVGMRERALAIGARLQARARAEGGTLVTLSWTARPDSHFGQLDTDSQFAAVAFASPTDHE